MCRGAGLGIVEGCEKAGIDMSAARVLRGERSSSYISIMDGDGDMLLAMSDMHIIKQLNAKLVDESRDLLCGADLVVCDGNLSAQTIERLAQVCDRPLYLDPVSTAWARELKPFIGCFDTVKPNRMELEVLSGCPVDTKENIVLACDILRGKGVRRVFVSLGRDGMYYRGPEGGIWGVSRPFDGMVNATGAGDASMAGIIYATRQGYAADEILAFGMGAGMVAIASSDTISREMSPTAIETMGKGVYQMKQFDLKAYMDVTPEIEEAVRTGKPVVALESTILSHGMPYPENLSFAREVEKIIREQGAIPATMAIIDGRLKCGLTEDELVRMCEAKGVLKVSRRDLPIVVAQKLTGATTVATTMILANMAGIHVFATGGIGGVHRRGEVTMDVSADLQELAHTPVAVVCAGAKMILDIGRTLEYLETMGVPVLGLNTDDFPAFYCRKSGFGVDYNAKTPADVAAIAKAKWGMGLEGGMLIGNPVPEEYAMDFDEMSAVIDRAMAMADEAGRARARHITPFLLAHIVELTGGNSLKTNIQLAYNNARAAAQIAVELAK